MIGVFSRFSWSLDFGAKMAEFPLPVLQIWRSRKRVTIQIQLMNSHVPECKYYCLHLVPKFGDMCDRQNWRLHPTARGWIQIGESHTLSDARILLGLKLSQDSRATSQRDSPIWIQPLWVFRYRQVGGSRRSTYATKTRRATWFSIAVRRSTCKANGIPHVTKLC